MSTATENARLQLEAFRTAQSGTPVVFRGETLYARVEDVAGAKAGEQGVPRGGLSQYIADTVPKAFIFNFSDFAPNTDRQLPDVESETEPEYIGYLGWSYMITAVTANTAGGGDGTAFGIVCFGLKSIFAGSGVAAT